MENNNIEIEKLKKEIEELESNIQYKFNNKGELINKKTNKKCQQLNEIEYNLIAFYTTKLVQYQMKKVLKLKTMYVPQIEQCPIYDFYEPLSIIPQCEIYTTKDFLYNNKCLLIIQGNGEVRPGIWSRQVCINDNLNKGSMIPYIELATKNKLSVIIFNPNERKDFFNDKKTIDKFSTMEKHCLYVYENIVKKNKNIKEIYIVAHSMGGECTVEILLNNKDDLLNGKIKKIAFTDSVHGEEYKKLGKIGVEKFREISRNYICSDKTVGKFVRYYTTSYGGVDCYSSGHKKHEYTSGTAIEKIFEFFNSDK